MGRGKGRLFIEVVLDDWLFHDNHHLPHEQQMNDMVRDIRRSLMVIMFCVIILTARSCGA